MTPVNPIRPRDIAWSVVVVLMLAAGAAAVLATPAAAAGGCVYTINGQDLDAASSPDRAIKVSNDQTVVLTASGPGPLGQLHVAAWFWPASVEVPQPAPTSDSSWTGTVDLAAQPVAVQGLYQIEISKDPADCPPSTGWLQISGGNPFLTVPGAIGTGMAVVGFDRDRRRAARGAGRPRRHHPRCDRRRTRRARSAHRRPASRSGAGRRQVRRGLDGAAGCCRGDGDTGGRNGLQAGGARRRAAELRTATADFRRRATGARATTDECRR